MSIIARQSTARTVTVGPVLDADGVAVTGGVVGDFKGSVNGGAPAALNGSATLTHRHTGFYSLALTATDLATVGSFEVVIDDTTNCCPMKAITVVEEAVYDALFAASALGYVANAPVNVAQISGDSTAADNAEAFFDGTGYAGTGNTIPAVTTVTNLTNAPTSGDLTATMKASVTAAVPTAAAVAAAVEAAILDEGDATALLAAIAAKVEDFILNEGDSRATLAAIASAVWANVSRTLTAGTNIDGSTFTEVPWNADWDAEVQSEVTDALTAYDPPTKAELDSAVSPLATSASIAALNNLSAAQVNAEVDTALADIHLDHLLATTYDPASKPGAADALLNELVESDGGVARYTANALEQAPTGGSAPTASAIADEVQTRTIAAVTTVTNLTNLPTMPTDWVTSSGVSAGAVTKIQSGLATPTNITAGTITTVTNLTNAPTSGDFTATMKSSITTAVPTAVNVAAAVEAAILDEGDATALLAAIATKVEEFILNEGDGRATLAAIGTAVWASATRTLTAGTNIVLSKGEGVTGFNDLSAAQVNAEVDSALADYDGPTKAELDSAVATLATAANQSILAGLISGLNNLSSAQVQTAAAAALTAYDPPTNAEMEARTLLTVEYATASALATADTVVDAIKIKTDQMVFGVANQLDVNVESMNTAAVLGNGTSGNKWRGA